MPNRTAPRAKLSVIVSSILRWATPRDSNTVASLVSRNVKLLSREYSSPPFMPPIIAPTNPNILINDNSGDIVPYSLREKWGKIGYFLKWNGSRAPKVFGKCLLSIENFQNSVDTWIWVPNSWIWKFINIQLPSFHGYKSQTKACNASTPTQCTTPHFTGNKISRLFHNLKLHLLHPNRNRACVFVLFFSFALS